MIFKTCFRCKESLPLDAFNKDKSKPHGVGNECRVCKKKYYNSNRQSILDRGKRYRENNPEVSKNYRETNRDQCRERVKEHYQRNSDKIKEYHRNHYVENREQILIHHKEYNKNNPDKLKDAVKRYKTKNPGKVIAWQAKYRSSKLNATPSWANLDKIEELYIEAQILTEMTGEQYHVDHIIPLQHPLVCGLHVENNLQILTASENCRKNNNFEI